MNEDNPTMKIYELQAIVIEKQEEIDRLTKKKNAEIDRLKREKDEMAERLGQMELEKQGTSKNFSGKKNNVWNAVNKLTEQVGVIQKETLKVNNTVHSLLPKKLENVGNIDQPQDSTILLIGEFGNGYQGIIVLNSERSKWTEVKIRPPCFISDSGAVSFNGELYIFGGDKNYKTMYKLDRNLKWKRLANLNIGRKGIANSCLEWKGCIWVFGGSDKNGVILESVEKYDPRENKWALMPELKQERSSAAAVLWKDRIVISGGNVANHKITRSLEWYIPENGWKLSSSYMSNCLYDHSIFTYKGELVVLGGRTVNGMYSTSCEFFSKIKWSHLPPFYSDYILYGGLVLDEEIYAISRQVKIFNGEEWRDGPSLPASMRNVSLSVIISQDLADSLCNYKP